MGTVDPKSRGAVLVVDDDEDIRSELRSVLEYGQYFVLEAEDGKQALDFLRSAAARAIRLIVLDLVMPYMSGWELVDLLRRDPALARIPVLVTSGMSVHGDASGIGATMSWLRKPFGADPFLTAVREAIDSAHASDGKMIPAGAVFDLRWRRTTTREARPRGKAPGSIAASRRRWPGEWQPGGVRRCAPYRRGCVRSALLMCGSHAWENSHQCARTARPLQIDWATGRRSTGAPAGSQWTPELRK